MIIPTPQEPLLAQVKNTTTAENTKKPSGTSPSNFNSIIGVLLLFLLSFFSLIIIISFLLFFIGVSPIRPNAFFTVVILIITFFFWYIIFRQMRNTKDEDTRKFIKYYQRQITVFFYPTYFSVVEKSQVADAQRIYDYAALKYIEETATTFILYINPTIFYIIPKNGFVIGSSNELFSLFSNLPNLRIKNHAKYAANI